MRKAQTETPPLTDSNRCGNCRSTLIGPFCHMCGQPLRSPVRELLSVARDGFDELFAFDGKLWRSLLPLYFRPGYLVQRYVEGQRIHFVKPLKLYLALSVIVFLVMSLTTNIDVKAEGDKSAPTAGINLTLTEKERAEWQKQQFIQFDVAGKPWNAKTNPVQFASMPQWVNQSLNHFFWQIDRTGHRAIDDPKILIDAFFRVLPTAVFLILPIAGLVLKAFYVFKSKLYAEHLLVVLQCHSFIFVSFLLMLLFGKMGVWFSVDQKIGSATLIGLLTAIALWVPIYLWLCLKRVYQQGWWMTSIKFIGIGMVYLFLIAIALSGALIAGLVSA
jgi:hypothetical protein